MPCRILGFCRAFFSMDDKAKKHFSKGEQDFRQADHEMYKPEEDIVSLVVCRGTLGSIENYLRGFLTLRGYETRDDECAGELMARCRMLDKKFNSIRIEEIDCRNENTHDLHCEEIEKLGACYQVADRLDTLMRKKGIL